MKPAGRSIGCARRRSLVIGRRLLQHLVPPATERGSGMETAKLTASERADALEHKMAMDLEQDIIVRSVLFTSGERDPTGPMEMGFGQLPPGRHVLQGDDPRLKKMPARPTLLDFFTYRMAPSNHLMQSARLARLNGHSEKIQLACLLHDIAVTGFIRSDHGYWG